ncbi:MAG TPA: bifunctional DNA primase/polymerase [Candidatus Limnocylindrales bacterium]|jgi:hypothetical protein
MNAQEWALRYAAAGWRVYPIEPATKKAYFTGWQTSATSDPDLIARQWRREPYPNIGVLCGETLAVFDIEEPHLPAYFAYLDAGGHVLPEMPICSTGRGGIHLYVRLIGGVPTTRKLRLDGVHIGEYKTSGGVVAPPSSTVGQYRWLWWPDEPLLTDAPSWLASLVAEPTLPLSAQTRRDLPADPAAALDALACAVRDEREGNRNSLLYWAACRALEEGIRPDIAERVLNRAAIAAGLSPAETDATLRSALKKNRVCA